MSDEPNAKPLSPDAPEATIPSRSTRLQTLLEEAEALAAPPAPPVILVDEKAAAAAKAQLAEPVPASEAPAKAVTTAEVEAAFDQELLSTQPVTTEKASSSETTPMPPPTPSEAPWMLRLHFDNDIDLADELSERFTGTPLMSQVSFRTTGTKDKHQVAVLATQDGAARLLVDADPISRDVEFSFTLGSMLTLGFRLTDLSDLDCNHWLERMRRDGGGLAFLWCAARWEQDYLVCVVRKYFTEFYAFAPNTHNVEAAARLTPDVTAKLLKWLETFWTPPPPPAPKEADAASISW